jgi:hypothetical protein
MLTHLQHRKPLQLLRDQRTQLRQLLLDTLGRWQQPILLPGRPDRRQRRSRKLCSRRMRRERRRPPFIQGRNFGIFPRAQPLDECQHLTNMQLVQVGAQTGTVASATNAVGGSTPSAGSNSASTSPTRSGLASTSGSASTPGSASTSGSRPSGAVIGGIVAGVVVGIVLIALVGLVCYRLGGRRNQSRVDGGTVLPVQQNPVQYSQRRIDEKVLSTELPTNFPRAELRG